VPISVEFTIVKMERERVVAAWGILKARLNYDIRYGSASIASAI
jgi:hypothetical protein